MSHRVSHPPPLPLGRSLPSVRIPAGRLPGPRAGRTTSRRRAARCLTDSSARSLSSAASVSRPPGRGPARFPRPIPWRCSSATTPRTCTAPPSRDTTWRPAWRRSWPANFSSAHPRIWFARMGVSVGLRSRLPTLAAFAFGGWAGDRRRRGPSPGQSHREPGCRMADDPGAWPLYWRGDFRRGRVRQDVGVYAPGRPPALRAGKRRIPSGAPPRWSLK